MLLNFNIDQLIDVIKILLEVRSHMAQIINFILHFAEYFGLPTIPIKDFLIKGLPLDLTILLPVLWHVQHRFCLVHQFANR